MDLEKVKVKINTKELDSTIKKVRKLCKLLKEANSLADELASKDLRLHIKL